MIGKHVAIATLICIGALTTPAIAQTFPDRPIKIVLFGESYWREVVNFDALVGHGMIAAEELALFRFANTPAEALAILQSEIAPDGETTPAMARTRTGTPTSETLR